MWSPALSMDPGHNVSEPLPVLFYIHGGSLVSGNGDYNFKGLKGEGIVVVSINYRLNVQGTPRYHSAVAARLLGSNVPRKECIRSAAILSEHGTSHHSTRDLVGTLGGACGGACRLSCT